jgi:DNA topoisomerase-2
MAWFQDEKVKGIKAGDYEYLLSMPIGTLTFEKVEQLRAERDKMEDDVEELKKASPKALWEKDLDEFLVTLDVSFVHSIHRSQHVTYLEYRMVAC